MPKHNCPSIQPSKIAKIGPNKHTKILNSGDGQYQAATKNWTTSCKLNSHKNMHHPPPGRTLS